MPIVNAFTIYLDLLTIPTGLDLTPSKETIDTIDVPMHKFKGQSGFEIRRPASLLITRAYKYSKLFTGVEWVKLENFYVNTLVGGSKMFKMSSPDNPDELGCFSIVLGERTTFKSDPEPIKRIYKVKIELVMQGYSA